MDQPSPWILDGAEATFEKDIIERSKELPVVVDFWATWCGPCKQLGPVLESLAREYDGKFVLVKVDVDQNPGIAQAFGVQSIPHVFALRNGQLVNQFVGVLPEPQIREWLDQLQPSPLETLLKEAQALEATDLAASEEKYREALAMAPGEDAIKIQIARILLKQHRDADSRKVLDELEARGYLEPDAENIKAELDLRAAAAEAGGVAECRAAVAANPNDPALKLKLAEAQAAVQQYPEALESLLELVKNNSGEIREQAKATMVNVFQLLGPESELMRTYRRKLSTALY